MAFSHVVSLQVQPLPGAHIVELIPVPKPSPPPPPPSLAQVAAAFTPAFTPTAEQVCVSRDASPPCRQHVVRRVPCSRMRALADRRPNRLQMVLARWAHIGSSS